MKFKIGDLVELKDIVDLDHKFYLPLQEGMVGVLCLVTGLPDLEKNPFYKVTPVVEYSDCNFTLVQALEDEMELIN